MQMCVFIGATRDIVIDMRELQRLYSDQQVLIMAMVWSMKSCRPLVAWCMCCNSNHILITDSVSTESRMDKVLFRDICDDGAVDHRIGIHMTKYLIHNIAGYYRSDYCHCASDALIHTN
eukprot:1014848_1